ncbi:MAG: sulfatase-like hydrolase/transferase [Akkermansiaceae bacterium]|nr:sulfatase-like hydrolase/transferase [Akkermansiaceae bacterium]
MNRILLSLALLGVLAVPLPAEPLVSSWFTDQSGAYARLYETTADESAGNAVTTWNRGQGVQALPTYAGIHEVSSDAASVYIRTTGLAGYVMGPWYLNAARTNLFPNYPSNTATLYRFDRDPGTPPASKTPTGLGAIGYFVDGVAMFDSRDAFSYDTSAGQDEEPNSGGGVNGDGIWNRDAYINEGVTFDAGNAHQAGNRYHYHANPAGLRHLLGDSVDHDPGTNTYTENFDGGHSPIIGWVRDSYPVYGPYGHDDPNDADSPVRRMISGYQKRDGTNGTTDLASTGRTSLPQWAADVQGIGPALASGQYGPNVNATYILGHYIEDYDFLGNGDLDLHGGRFCVTPEFPGGTYAYFTAIEADGTPVYPYNIGRTYYGNPTGATVGSIPDGATVHFEGGPEVTGRHQSTSIDESTGDVTVVWSAAEGGTYDIQAGPSPGALASLPTTAGAVGNTVSVTDAGRANSDEVYFYRAGLLALDPFDDAGFDTGGGGAAVFTATFPTTPPLPPQNAVTSITVGGVAATILSYDQATGVVELDFDDSSLAPGFYNAVLTFTPPGGSPTMVTSTNQHEVVDTSGANNILLIIVDDWGVDSSPIDNNSTLNPGTTFPTMANLQALAANGVRFTNGYSQPVCSPMRAAIMTGRQAWRTGVGNPGHPLTTGETTLPEAFAAAGSPYQLASFGKWHLGGGNTGYDTLGGWPHFVGITGGGVPNQPDGYTNWPKNDNGTVTTGFTTYSTTDQVDEARTFIDAQEGAGNPWFVWMGFNAPHTPFHEPPAALLQGGTGTSNRELYEKALEALDTEIGRLLESVDFATTNVFLVGDNGTPNQVVQAPFGAGHSKSDIYEGGIHVPFVARGPDVALAAGSTSDRFVHVVDLFPTILELAGVPLPGTGVDATSLVPILNGTDTTPRCVVAEKFADTATFTAGDGRSLRMEADPAYPGSNPDYKLLIFANPFDAADVPTYEFYNVVTDGNEVSPLNIGALNATEQAAYDALLAKEATLGGGYNDPGVPFSGDTLYIQLPSTGVTPQVPNLTRPNGNPLNVTSCTVTGATGTVTATVVGRFNSGAALADEADDAQDRYWVKVQVPADAPYTTAHVVFPDTPTGTPREYDSINILVKP